ncbi:hypothetical protein HMPREF9946_03409 [Acetobacteraceae bacterium AT-5844]|nr:hypothetical protein HMPREF9946_03409 [Acetobacteraceae bacterium AT-5844]
MLRILMFGNRPCSGGACAVGWPVTGGSPSRRTVADTPIPSRRALRVTSMRIARPSHHRRTSGCR